MQSKKQLQELLGETISRKELTKWVIRQRLLPRKNGQALRYRRVNSEKRYAWENSVENQRVNPLRYYTPTSIQDIVQIVRAAQSEGYKVRALGSGLSFSDVIQTTDFLINTEAIRHPLELDRTVLKDQHAGNSNLVQVESGMKIHELNTYLDEHGLALPNAGAHDAQSIIGASSTSTHGSGITLGPIPSFYRSIVLVGTGGQIYRIEPANGITDPEKYKMQFPQSKLVQDDEWFNTVCVSMGCTGVIYSVILEVEPKYWLKETRFLSNWSDVKHMLRKGILHEHRHFEFLLHPYKIKGDHPCLITIRNRTDEPAGPVTDKQARNFFAQLVGHIPGISFLFDFIFDTFPALSPTIVEWAMKQLEDDEYTNKSYKVLNLGSPNRISAYSSEIGFPIEGDTYIDAIDEILRIAERIRQAGSMYHTAPMGVRFVKASNAYLSMMHERDTCTVEIPVINRTFGGFELLKRYEKAMLAFDGRPHWGQVNYLNPLNVMNLYPSSAYTTWVKVYKELNRDGTFSNQFTDRCGF